MVLLCGSGWLRPRPGECLRWLQTDAGCCTSRPIPSWPARRRPDCTRALDGGSVRFEQTDDRLGHRVVVGVPDRPNRGLRAGLGEPFGVADRGVLGTSVRMMNEPPEWSAGRVAAAKFPSRGRPGPGRSSSTRGPTPPTARSSGGLRAATAKSAGKHRTTRPGPAGEHGRNGGYLSRCGNSSSTQSTMANRSGRSP